MAKLKICRVTEKRSAESLIEAGVDYLGFHLLDPSRAPIEKYSVLTQQLSALGFDNCVMVTKSTDLDWVSTVLRLGRYRYVQMHRQMTIAEIEETVTKLGRANAELIQTVDPATNTPEYAEQVAARARFVLYDNYVGGSGRPHESGALEGFPMASSFIAGGVSATSAPALVAEHAPYGLDVQSWVENVDKTKNLQRVEALLQALGRSHA